MGFGFGPEPIGQGVGVYLGGGGHTEPFAGTKPRTKSAQKLTGASGPWPMTASRRNSGCGNPAARSTQGQLEGHPWIETGTGGRLQKPVAYLIPQW